MKNKRAKYSGRNKAAYAAARRKKLITHLADLRTRPKPVIRNIAADVEVGGLVLALLGSQSTAESNTEPQEGAEEHD